MAYTVWGAFDSFRREAVDLTSARTSAARASRDYLKEQLNRLADTDALFPRIQKKYIDFGSFARRTKIRLLDDIDTLMLLKAGGTKEVTLSLNSHTVGLRLDDANAALAPFCNEIGFIDSDKILNRIRSSLRSIPNYGKADIKRSGEAVVLNLASYEWVFDIVPAAPIKDDAGGTAHYLIPNGYGNWKRTDPRTDARHITKVNQAHSEQFLPLVRLLKYWHRNIDCPTVSSYYLETIAWKVFKDTASNASFPGLLQHFFENAKNQVFRSCPDPKGLGPPLDQNVTWEDKIGLYVSLYFGAYWGGDALKREANGDADGAMFYWRLVFGDEFPQYG